MGKCVSVELKDLRECSDARITMITEKNEITAIVKLWPNIQLTLNVVPEDSVAWSCDRNGHVFNLLQDYDIPCRVF